MASKKTSIKESECGDKHRFASLKAAIRFLKKKDLDELHAYFCRFCRRVHVGH